MDKSMTLGQMKDRMIALETELAGVNRRMRRLELQFEHRRFKRPALISAAFSFVVKNSGNIRLSKTRAGRTTIRKNRNLSL